MLHTVLRCSRSLNDLEWASEWPSEVPQPCACMYRGAGTADVSFCAAGCEDGSLRLWDSRCSRAAVEVLRAHATRIRGVTATGVAHPASAAAGADVAFKRHCLALHSISCPVSWSIAAFEQ